MRCSAALVLAIVVTACAGATPPPAAVAEDPAGTELPEQIATAVRGAVEQYRQAYAVRSVEALAELYAHSLDLNLVNQGVRLRGWTAVQEHLRDLLGGADEVRLELQDVVIVPAGAGAVVTARVERDITRDLATVTERGVLTLVFREDLTGWQIVAEHFSYPVGD